MDTHTLNETSFQFTENGKSYDVTFHANKGFSSFAASEFTQDPAVNEKVRQAYIALMPHENKIIEWISQSPDNGRKYIENPVQAMENANMGIPQDIIQMIKNASELLVTTLKK
ncbi:hypothetical protein [Chryseobacterium culicis]|uniref:hypothetical protein n=1 Tax=Chryseobacterium culicis TaxID=680127 RepID=UPI00187454BD|nr:hypothetical protein [Chryseobacterium culicis]MBE4947963.1 hypothetical protein [Chryseobacterium culicis]